jgi:hypothetical protein
MQQHVQYPRNQCYNAPSGSQAFRSPPSAASSTRLSSVVDTIRLSDLVAVCSPLSPPDAPCSVATLLELSDRSVRSASDAVAELGVADSPQGLAVQLGSRWVCGLGPGSAKPDGILAGAFAVLASTLQGFASDGVRKPDRADVLSLPRADGRPSPMPVPGAESLALLAHDSPSAASARICPIASWPIDLISLAAPCNAPKALDALVDSCDQFQPPPDPAAPVAGMPFPLGPDELPRDSRANGNGDLLCDVTWSPALECIEKAEVVEVNGRNESLPLTPSKDLFAGRGEASADGILGDGPRDLAGDGIDKPSPPFTPAETFSIAPSTETGST